MTTVAWDGKVLAADRLFISGEIKHYGAKVWRLKDGALFAGAGQGDVVISVRQWLEEHGAESVITGKNAPRCGTDCNVSTLTVLPGGRLYHSHDRCVGVPVTLPFFAIGAGREFAFMAMHLGKSAVQAVLLAQELSPSSGGGVDWFELGGASGETRT